MIVFFLRRKENSRTFFTQEQGCTLYLSCSEYTKVSIRTVGLRLIDNSDKSGIELNDLVKNSIIYINSFKYVDSNFDLSFLIK